eukprot:6215077-Pyramimonas_sp.AAC.1
MTHHGDPQMRNVVGPPRGMSSPQNLWKVGEAVEETHVDESDTEGDEEGRGWRCGGGYGGSWGGEGRY